MPVLVRPVWWMAPVPVRPGRLGTLARQVMRLLQGRRALPVLACCPARWMIR